MRLGMQALGRCLVGALAALVLLAAGASAADRIYWSNAGDPGDHGIAFANVDGTAVGGLDITRADRSEPIGLALDPMTGRIYWGNFAGSVSFFGLGDADRADLTFADTMLSRPWGVAVDPVNRRLYWSDEARNAVSASNLDGAVDGDLTLSGATVSTPLGVAVDPTAGRLYWVNAGGANPSGAGVLSFANLDGNDAHDLTIVPRAMSTATVNQPSGIAVDPIHGRIYWSNVGNVISSAKLDGTDAVDLPIDTTTVTLANPQGLAIDPFGGRIYWTSHSSATPGVISSAKLDGTDAHDIPAVGVTLNEPGYPLLLVAPRAADPPTITGGPDAGATLSCSRGAWAPDVVAAFFYESPQSYAYQWSRDATDIPGATQSTLRADVGGAYRCRVTARNASGGTEQTSDAHAVAGVVVPDDTTPPRLGGVSLTHTRFRVAKAHTAIAAAARTPILRGTVLRFTSSEAGRLSLVIERVRSGRRARRGAKTVCVAVRRPVKRGGCTILSRTATLTRAIKAGRGSVALSGRIGAKAMAPGSYRLRVTGRDAAGNVSKPVVVSFTILAG